MIVLPRLTIILQCVGVIVVIRDVLMADVSSVSVKWMILALLWLLCNGDYGHRLLDVGSPVQSILLKSKLFFVFFTLICLYRPINLPVIPVIIPSRVKCVETWAAFALSSTFSAFYSILSPHMWACVGGAAVSGSTDLSNLGSDCYNHPNLTTPTPTLTTTVYNITSPPTSFLLLNFHTYYVFVGGHCLSRSRNLVSAAMGNLLLYFCFYFVKLMIHIVLEPPATIKTVKSYPGCLSLMPFSSVEMSTSHRIDVSI